MLSDTKTLYKLMVLYMLKQVGSPVAASSLSDFFISHQYTNYFTLQDVYSELSETELISISNMQNSVRYTITHDGEETLGFFSNKIPAGIIDDINSYLKDNKFKIRNEVGTSANFYKSTGQDYIVHCEVLEGKAPLIAIDLSIPDKDQAERMSKNWKSKSQDIYSYIIKKLAQ